MALSGNVGVGVGAGVGAGVASSIRKVSIGSAADVLSAGAQGSGNSRVNRIGGAGMDTMMPGVAPRQESSQVSEGETARANDKINKDALASKQNEEDKAKENSDTAKRAVRESAVGTKVESLQDNQLVRDPNQVNSQQGNEIDRGERHPGRAGEILDKKDSSVEAVAAKFGFGLPGEKGAQAQQAAQQAAQQQAMMAGHGMGAGGMGGGLGGGSNNFISGSNNNITGSGNNITGNNINVHGSNIDIQGSNISNSVNDFGSQSNESNNISSADIPIKIENDEF
jgi:hypothetical protein